MLFLVALTWIFWNSSFCCVEDYRHFDVVTHIAYIIPELLLHVYYVLRVLLICFWELFERTQKFEKGRKIWDGLRPRDAYFQILLRTLESSWRCNNYSTFFFHIETHAWAQNIPELKLLIHILLWLSPYNFQFCTQ